MGITAAVYLRISQDRDGAGLGVERQREACVQVCEARGWAPMIYTENDTSASGSKPRPVYQQMLEDIKAGRVQALVVWDLDRLTRRPIELEHIIALADRTGLLMASVDREIDLATPGGRMFARVKGAFARGEMDQKSQRQKAANEQRMKAGKISSPIPAFGYNKDQSINPDLVPIVREMYRRFNSGASLLSIRDWLNHAGVRTSLGNKWGSASIKAMLRNPRYCGLRGAQRMRPGRQYRDQYYEIVGPGTWEPIVDQETWETAVRILRDPSRRTTPGGQVRHLLSGIARCYCGERVYVGAAARKSGPVPLLICPRGQHMARVMAPIEELVVAVLHRYLSDPAHAALWTRPAGPAVDVPALVVEVEEARARVASLAKDYGAGLFTRSEYLDARESARQVMARCEAELAAATSSSPAGRLVASGVPVAQAWAEMDLAQRRALLADTLRVVVHPGQMGRRPFDPATVEISPVV